MFIGAILLANHGPAVSGKTPADAQYAIEELEETAGVHLLVHERAIRPLTEQQAASLRRE